jgi:hypothetical protein
MQEGDENEALVFPESDDGSREGQSSANAAGDVEELPVGDFAELQDPLNDELDQSSSVI